jgi:hypothetical protein
VASRIIYERGTGRGAIRRLIFEIVNIQRPKYREPKSINWKHNFKIFIDSVEDYARQWEKREKEDLDTLSEWVKSVRSLIQTTVSEKNVCLFHLS